MKPKLTPEMRDALNEGGGPVAVEDDENQRVYYLVDESTFTTLQQHDDLASIREGIADMEAGRVMTLEELDARIRSRLESLSKA